MSTSQLLAYDSLTGALARDNMAACIQSALDDAQQAGGSFALVMLDMDEFKSINDAFGHARGDQVLVEVARRIQGAVRASDQVFRYGGDEFILLLRGSPREPALHVAGRVQAALVQQPAPGSPPVSLSASLGLAVYPEDASTPEELFEVIDQRMRLSKARGRGGLVADGQASPPLSGAMGRAPDRMVEREPALQQVRAFMSQLGQMKRGLLLVSGPPGSGRTRIIEETARIARLQGYAIWSGQGAPGYEARRFGLLAEMQQAAGWRELHTRPADLAAALDAWLQDKQRTGLLICLDNLSLVDPVTLECLLGLLELRPPAAVRLPQTDFLPAVDKLAAVNYQPAANHQPAAHHLPAEQLSAAQRAPIGLICSGSLLPALQAVGQALPLYNVLALNPISEHGVQVWLRHGLHWEAEPEFTHWLWQQTGGLPALITGGLDWLVQQGILRSEPGQWVVSKALLPDHLPAVLDARPGLMHNLPVRLPPFFGRAKIIWRVKNLLPGTPLVTLRAPDGAGKTRLAMQVATELRDGGQGGGGRGGVLSVDSGSASRRECAFPDGIFRLAYPPGLPPGRLPFLMGEALQLRGVSQEDPLAGLAAGLAGKRTLLVIDDLNPSAEDAPLLTGMLEELLRQAPGLRLLVTARQALGLTVEACLDLEGLSYPAEFARPSEYPAGQFFLHEAQQAWPVFNPSPDDEQAIWRICRQVEGLPLGLELAAAWVSSYTCQDIANEIEDNLGLLLSAPNGDDRPGLLAVFDAFWLLFSPEEQGVVASMAVFKGSFSLEAARRVTAASRFFLDALAVKRFLHLLPGGRYLMHPLLARYVQTRLYGDPQRAAQVRQRHASFFLNELRKAWEPANNTPRDLRALQPDLLNLHAAWQDAVTMRWVEGLAQAEPALFELLGMLNQYNEALELAQAALAVLNGGPSEEERFLKARLFSRVGEFCYHTGDYARGEQSLLQALNLLPDLPGDMNPPAMTRVATEQAQMMLLLANLKQAHGEYAQALVLLEQARGLATRLGLPGLLFNIINRAGGVAFQQRDYALAAQYYENGLAVARSDGAPARVAVALNNLGEVAALNGQYDRARSLLLESLSLTRPNGSRTLHGAVLETLGLLERESGRLRQAALYFERALRATLDIDAGPLILEIFGNVAELWEKLALQDPGGAWAARAADLARLVMDHPAAQHAIRQHAGELAARLAGIPPEHPNWTPQNLRRVVVEVLELLA